MDGFDVKRMATNFIRDTANGETKFREEGALETETEHTSPSVCFRLFRRGPFPDCHDRSCPLCHLWSLPDKTLEIRKETGGLLPVKTFESFSWPNYHCFTIFLRLPNVITTAQKNMVMKM